MLGHVLGSQGSMMFMTRVVMGQMHARVFTIAPLVLEGVSSTKPHSVLFINWSLLFPSNSCLGEGACALCNDPLQCKTRNSK